MITLILVGVGSGGCSLSRTEAAFAKMGDRDSTGAIGLAAGGPAPTEGDLAFARNAASDVLTKGDKDSSQPWENPETGARGSVTPLAQAYSSDGRTCRARCVSPTTNRPSSGRRGLCRTRTARSAPTA